MAPPGDGVCIPRDKFRRGPTGTEYPGTRVQAPPYGTRCLHCCYYYKCTSTRITASPGTNVLGVTSRNSHQGRRNSYAYPVPGYTEYTGINTSKEACPGTRVHSESTLKKHGSRVGVPEILHRSK
eukprot:1363311-Rhodomonas_salina.1